MTVLNLTVPGVPESQGSLRQRLQRTLDNLLPDRPDGECWEWRGVRHRNGYGGITVRINGKAKGLLAHRVAYEILHGPIPEGLTLDHLCRNRSCCNPAHLEPVSQAENTQRGQGWLGGRCKRGHHLTPENIYTAKNGRRQCKGCWKSRKVEAAARRAA